MLLMNPIPFLYLMNLSKGPPAPLPTGSFTFQTEPLDELFTDDEFFSLSGSQGFPLGELPYGGGAHIDAQLGLDLHLIERMSIGASR